MKQRLHLWRFWLVLLVLASSPASLAQQTQQPSRKALSYGFVSPNTREDMKLDEAIKGMSSAEEAKLLNKAVNLGCVVRTQIRAARALGVWSDGAEYTVMMRVNSDLDTLRYLMSRLGRDAQQKYIIYFQPAAKGSVDLYRLWLPKRTRNLAALSAALERGGIPFRTLVPSRRGTAIYIIDLDGNLKTNVTNVARTLRAQVSHQDGDSALIGHDTREQAKSVFDEEIKRYETKNPNLPPTCDMRKKNQPRINTN